MASGAFCHSTGSPWAVGTRLSWEISCHPTKGSKQAVHAQTPSAWRGLVPKSGWCTVPALKSKLGAEQRCLGFVCQLMVMSNICPRGVCLSQAWLGDGTGLSLDASPCRNTSNARQDQCQGSDFNAPSLVGIFVSVSHQTIPAEPFSTSLLLQNDSTTCSNHLELKFLLEQ